MTESNRKHRMRSNTTEYGYTQMGMQRYPNEDILIWVDLYTQPNEDISNYVYILIWLCPSVVFIRFRLLSVVFSYLYLSTDSCIKSTSKAPRITAKIALGYLCCIKLFFKNCFTLFLGYFMLCHVYSRVLVRVSAILVVLEVFNFIISI